MTKSPLGLMNIIMLGPLLAFGNVYFGSPLPEILLLTLIGVSYPLNNGQALVSILGYIELELVHF